MQSALDRWRRDYPESSLVAGDHGDETVVDDRRRGWPHRRHRLDGWRAAGHRILAERRTVPALRSRLAEQGYDVDGDVLGDWLQGMRRDGLVFVDGSSWLALATRSAVSEPAVAWLRDRQGAGTAVRWRARGAAALDLLCHLPPPEGAEFEDWRSRFAPGLCYYRCGPGFIQVKDVRAAGAAASFVLDEPELLETFTGCLEPKAFADLPARLRDAASALVEERLLLRSGEQVVTLPYRMRRWPIPAYSV